MDNPRSAVSANLYEWTLLADGMWIMHSKMPVGGVLYRVTTSFLRDVYFDPFPMIADDLARRGLPCPPFPAEMRACRG